MDTVLEQQRRFHEERERLIQSIVNELLEKKGTVKEQTNSDHRAKLMQDRYMTITKDLKELYEDKDGYRREEIKVMSGPKAFGQFYAKLKSIKDFYKSHPTEIAVPMSIEFENLQKNLQDPVEDLVKFTDEEGHGKYLDLHQAFEKYLNVKGIEPIDYVSYLTNFDKFYDIPKEKKTNEYKRYLQFLLDYLTEYCGKAYPLLDVNEEIRDVEEKFTNAWNEGTFPGWPKEDSGDFENATPQEYPPIDLDSYSSPEELASLGLDRLKHALKSMNLKCGGTLEERAKRLFDAKGKKLDELPSTFKAKERAMMGKQLEQMRKKEIASLEAKLYYFSELFGEQKVATKENVQRKQAMAAGEIERELSDDEEIDINSSDDDLNDENDIPYNPKNLPLSWDGKPIPYWLYKLHGLNINYNCEICGNQIYRGPKAFQRHFSEWRHAHGMRCLGIPNTAHFANVTNIEDAVALWEKLKIQKNIERWKPEVEEEYEDTEGNVVNRRTYEDLKRQDLL